MIMLCEQGFRERNLAGDKGEPTEPLRDRAGEIRTSERCIQLRFSSPIPDLSGPRLIATLWCCIRRRIFNSSYTTFVSLLTSLVKGARIFIFASTRI